MTRPPCRVISARSSFLKCSGVMYSLPSFEIQKNNKEDQKMCFCLLEKIEVGFKIG
tara:strand:- start:120 stop:287 length:168 start_codon:yes stop_codon:yes gene_type:complete